VAAACQGGARMRVAAPGDAMTLAIIQARIARLSASLRSRPSLRRLELRRGYEARQCDECHRRLVPYRFDGRSPTCRQCDVELSTPARTGAA
jgi:hypothetical protein